MTSSYEDMAQLGFRGPPFLWGLVKPLRCPLVRSSLSVLVLPGSLHSGSCPRLAEQFQQLGKGPPPYWQG